MDEPDFPVARILVAIIPAVLVFLFFVSVLFVPVVQSATEDGYSPPDVLAMLDESARSMPYGGWLEQQRQKRPGRFFENAVCVICLDMVEKSHEVRDLPCAHVFHTACLDGWVSRGHYYCPLCHELVMQLLRDQPEAASQV
ncbi:ring finger domain protein [Neofusicoccum parvum]|nr:ring finger domain protein [Neofusicoccum parvum]